MGFLIVLGCSIAGWLLGGMTGGDGAAVFGLCVGIAAGLLLLRQRSLDARLSNLERLHAARGMRADLPATPDEAWPEPVPEWVAEAARSARESAVPPAVADAVDVDPAPIEAPIEVPASAAAPPYEIHLPEVEPPPRAPAAPSIGERMRRWFSEGNVPVKIGMLVLFAGVAALLKHAADQGWLRLPIELRLAGVALAATAALLFGWRQRRRKRGFSLALQGGAIGILLLTVFAAFRLYQLLPAGAAFALLLVLVAGAGLLAVLQDSLALAVLAILAGFAAPILVSTGSGSHVVLFGYYAVLNLGILAIAWNKPWRVLNLIGFFCTFAVGTAWGVLRYEPALLRSTEPFLLLFFAIYLAIPLLYARRGEPQRRGVVDGTLVFGNPLFAFALQAALLDGERMPLAFCAIALAALYALLAWWLLRRRRVLGESFALLAAGFATLALPLALSARTTACAFALEGAALVWLGLRQQQRLVRWAGLALQLLAAVAFVVAIEQRTGATGATGEIALANGVFAGALLIAIAGFASAWAYANAHSMRLALLLHLWGLAWWLGAGLHEIDRFVPIGLQAAAMLAFAGVSAAIAALAFRRTRLDAPAWTAALALGAGVPVALTFAHDHAQPFTLATLAAVATFGIAGWHALRRLRDAPDASPLVARLGWLWSWTVLAAALLQRLCRDAGLGSGWIAAAWMAPLALAWLLALRKPAALAPPMAERFAQDRPVLLVSQAIVGALGFANTLLLAGASTPLPFVPLLNPLEIAQLALLACLAYTLASRAADGDGAPRNALWPALAAFAFVTAATLRGVHHLGGVPWDDALWSSHLAQTALTIAWSLLGMLGWILGSRRGRRGLWLAGAVLMAVVLLKLLLIDRGHLGNLFGIVSFIAYGLLCTVIGYFAPAPPREAAREGA